MLQGGPTIIAAALIGYLFGSIPFGLLLTRMAGLGDVRSIGSGNIGATNVLRTGRKGLAAGTLLLDMLKGTAAVTLAGFLGPHAAIIAGLSAFAGHLFPIWLGFKGGKGVATYLGVLLGLAWPAALLFAAVWLATAFVSRYSSLAALLAMLAAPLTLYFRVPSFLYDSAQLFDAGKIALVVALMSAVSWYMHRANIARLIAGTESRIGSNA